MCWNSKYFRIWRWLSSLNCQISCTNRCLLSRLQNWENIILSSTEVNVFQQRAQVEKLSFLLRNMFTEVLLKGEAPWVVNSVISTGVTEESTRLHVYRMTMDHPAGKKSCNYVPPIGPLKRPSKSSTMTAGPRTIGQHARGRSATFQHPPLYRGRGCTRNARRGVSSILFCMSSTIYKRGFSANLHVAQSYSASGKHSLMQAVIDDQS